MCLAGPAAAQDIFDYIRTLPLPTLGPVSCSGGGSGPDPLGSPCDRNVNPNGDVAVYGIYDDENDRANTVIEGTDFLTLEATDGNLLFERDNGAQLFVDSSSLELSSTVGSTLLQLNDGVADINPNASLFMYSQNFTSGIQVGNGNGGNGLFSIYESDVLIESFGVGEMANAILDVGRDGGSGSVFLGDNDFGRTSTLDLTSTGGTAALRVENGNAIINKAQVNLLGNLGVEINVGAEEDGIGSLSIVDKQGSLTTSGSGQTMMRVGGAPGSNGSVTVSGGSLTLTNANNDTELWIAGPRMDPPAGDFRDAGTGSVSVSGYVEQEFDPSLGMDVPVDRPGFLFANTINVGASADAAGLGQGGSGTLTIGNLGTVQTDNLNIGEIQRFGGGDSNGFVNVTTGGTLLANSVDETTNIGANGTLRITGTRARGNFYGIDAEGSNPNNEALITLGGGGVLDVRQSFLRLGSSSRLNGTLGQVRGNILMDGGSLGPGNSPGQITIDGDLILSSGVVDIELGGSTSDLYDALTVNGSVIVPNDSTATISVRLINGFTPDLDDVFDIFNVGGGVDAGFADRFVFTGFSNAPTLFGDGLGSFALAYSDPFVAPVPLPAGGVLLIGGLFALRRLRKVETERKGRLV